MKKLALALILALVLSLTIATPVLAEGPPDVAKKGLERAITIHEGNDHTYGSLYQGLFAPWYYGQKTNWGGPIVAYHVIGDLLDN